MKRKQPEPSEFISSKEAADILLVTPRHVILLINRGEFPGTTRPGRGYLIPRKAVHDYIIRKDKESRNA